MNELQTFEEQNQERLRRYLAEVNPGHDEIQLKYFVVGSGITDYGMYRQALLEINTRYEGLKINYSKRKKLDLEMRIIERDKVNVDGDLERQMKEVEIEEKMFQIETLDKQISRSISELKQIFVLATEYEEKIKGKEVSELIKDYHTQRLAKLLAMNTVWRGGNLSGVMDIVTTLPDEMQKTLVDELSRLYVIEHKNSMLSSANAQKLLEDEAKGNQLN